MAARSSLAHAHLALTSLGNLASACHSAGMPTTAIPLYEQANDARERTQGPDHPDTLTSRVLAYLPPPREPELLEQLGRRAEQEPALSYAAGGGLGDRFD